MRVIYDAAVLVAAERNDRATWLDHRRRLERGIVPMTTAPVVAQVSRSPRQTMLHRLLASCEVVPFAPEDAHPVGFLLARARSSDVVDAHLVYVASGDDSIIKTGDVADISSLASVVAADIVVEPA